jgi:thioredoxin reductase
MTHDALIIGGGPAGCSCALWLKQLGHAPLIIEQRGQLGGLQNDKEFPNKWVAGLRATTGIQLAEQMHAQMIELEVPLLLGARVTTVQRTQGGFQVSVETEKESTSRAAPYVIVASGVKPQSAGLRPTDTVLIGPGTHVDTYDFVGKSVAILGGGDNAFDYHPFIEQRGAKSVHTYARGIRAGRKFTSLVSPQNVFVGNHSVNQDAHSVNGRVYDCLVVLCGWAPNSGVVAPLGVRLRDGGFICVDERCETSVPGVFAIGEVAQRLPPCCVTSMADGVSAATEVQRRLEAGSASEYKQKCRRADEP